MESCPKVTIITIAKNLYKDNRIELFKQCLESVHNQTYPNIEHIIIDGASTDGTLEFIKPYEEKGWVKVFSQEDKCSDDAYNKGTERATGKYLAWMNSDDFYYDDRAVEYSVTALENENADYSYGKQVTYTRDGKQVGEFIPHLEWFYCDMPFSHQTLFLKKEILVKLGGYDDTFFYGGGDYFLVLQLILHDYKGVFVDKYISHYTLGGFSGSWDNKFRVYTCLSILAKRSLWFYHQFYKNIDEDEAQVIYFNRQKYNAYPKLLLEKMIRFMVEKQLKNFNYNNFINYINTIKETVNAESAQVNNYYTNNYQTPALPNTKKIYIFDCIKILSIERKQNPQKVYVKLFGCIPFLKIREK